MEVQTLHLQMELANTLRNTDRLRSAERSLLALIDRITVFGGTDEGDLRNLAGGIGNCGVELEKGELFQEAEDIWKRAIGLCARQGGLHIQYSDFLIDRGRVEEALAELHRARELSPNDVRLLALEMKISLASGRNDPTLGDKLRASFEQNRADRMKAAAYLMYLAKNGEAGRFEEVCREWEMAAPEEQKVDAARVLADHLATNDQPDRAKLDDEDDRHAVLHNLASVCAAGGVPEDAEKYWRQAYGLRPLDAVVRTTFSQFLSRRGKLDLALKVASGESI
jgi:tetratricopeptide (TPR) repeat protein